MGLRDWLPFLPRDAAVTTAAPAHGVRAATQQATGTVIDIRDPAVQEYLRGGGQGSADGAMRIAAAWRCVHILAGVPGNMPLDLMERVGEGVRRPAEGHPVRQVIATRPNHWQTPQDFKRMLTAWVALRGNGYAIKVAGLRGVQALWPIHPDRIEPKQGPDMSLVYEYTSASGAKRLLPQADVLHVRGLTLDGIKGLGVLEAARRTIGNASKGGEVASRVFDQGVLAGGALEVPNRLSDESFGRLKESLEEKNSGAENAGKWIILEEGMKASQLALTAQDMQFLESRQFELRQIAMFFGVPPHMIGDTEKATSWGSGIDSQTQGFVTFTEEDYLTAWEQALERDLLTLSEQARFYVRFNRAALVRGDITTRTQAYQRALQWGWMSPNEVRALEDLNPRPDGERFYDPPNQAGGQPAAQTEPSNAPQP